MVVAVLAGLTGTSNEIWVREMYKNQTFLQNDGFDGPRRYDFGVREMYKNPILWTTLTGLTGLTERSRMLNGKNEVPKCSKTQHFARL